jgi:hypothetical protein
MVTFTQTAERFMKQNHLSKKYIMSVLDNPESTFRESSRMVWAHGYGWSIRIDLDRMEVSRIKADSRHKRYAHLAA